MIAKILVLTSAIMVSSASFGASAQSIECKFLTPDNELVYELSGKLDEKAELTVTKIVKVADQIEKLEDEINNNPVPRKLTPKHRYSKYVIDSLDEDPDYGDIFVLRLPGRLATQELAAELSYTYYSRGPTPTDYVKGTCVIEDIEN